MSEYGLCWFPLCGIYKPNNNLTGISTSETQIITVGLKSVDPILYRHPLSVPTSNGGSSGSLSDGNQLHPLKAWVVEVWRVIANLYVSSDPAHNPDEVHTNMALNACPLARCISSIFLPLEKLYQNART